MSLEIDHMKKSKVSELEEINKNNERALIDQSDLYKSKLVVEYVLYYKEINFDCKLFE